MDIENAKLQIQKFVEENKTMDKGLLEKKLSDLVIEYSHKIEKNRPKQFGIVGHFRRQEVRKELRQYVARLRSTPRHGVPAEVSQ